MLGLSDTTVGAIVSVVLHAGVVAAFFGPLGQGEGAGANVVMVSIDGVEAPESLGQELQKGDPQSPVAPRMPLDLQGAVQAPKEQSEAVPRRVALMRRQRPAQPLVSEPTAPQAAEPGGGGLLGTLYSQPVMLSMPKPFYPRRARERGIEGKVALRVWIAVDGTVERAEVVKSSGFDLFDQAARESALEATFKPALKAGVPTTAEKTMVVAFSLVE